MEIERKGGISMTNELQAAPKAEKAKKKNSRFSAHGSNYKLKEIRKNWVLYLFMLPFLLVFVVLTILPVVYGNLLQLHIFQCS